MKPHPRIQNIFSALLIFASEFGPAFLHGEMGKTLFNLGLQSVAEIIAAESSTAATVNAAPQVAEHAPVPA